MALRTTLWNLENFLDKSGVLGMIFLSGVLGMIFHNNNFSFFS